MKRRVCVFIMTLTIVCQSFAGLKYLEKIQLINMTDEPIFITYELKNGPSDPLRNYFFDVIIQDKWFMIGDGLFNSSVRCLRPNYIYTILEYNYKDSTGKRIYDFSYVDCIPFMEKILSIYSKLEVKTESGKLLLNLDNIQQQLVRKYVFGKTNSYMIRIFDFDDNGNLIPQTIPSIEEIKNYEDYPYIEKKAAEW